MYTSTSNNYGNRWNYDTTVNLYHSALTIPIRMSFYYQDSMMERITVTNYTYAECIDKKSLISIPQKMVVLDIKYVTMQLVSHHKQWKCFYYAGETGQQTQYLPISFPKEPINLYLNLAGDEPDYNNYRFWFWYHTNEEPINSFGYIFYGEHTDRKVYCTLSAFGY